MADKKKNPRYVSPAGIASWPKVRTPDTKFAKAGEKGTFSIKLLLDPQKDAAFLEKLDTMAAAALEAMKKEHTKFSKVMKLVSPYAPELDKEGNETGKIVVNFTSPAEVTRKKDGKKFDLKITVFDAMLTPIPAETDIGGGSIVKVSFESWPYFSAKEKEAGITRRLIGVQVLELKQWSGSASASDFGFEEEEGFSGINDSPEGDDSESGSASETADF
jgi:hypothetical protein